eukprot:2323749-Pyramimonas_sp.AAC.1
MAEVLRVETREFLCIATSISLSLDESKYCMAVRYCADAPAPGSGRSRRRGFRLLPLWRARHP